MEPGAGDRVPSLSGDVWGHGEDGAGTHIGHRVIAAGGYQAELFDVSVGFHGLADGLQRGDGNVLWQGDVGVTKGMGTSLRMQDVTKGM